MEARKVSRIDVIGQNGNDGEHYEKMKRLSCLSCQHYRIRYNEEYKTYLCSEGHNDLVPYAGSFDCEDFDYAPGSDEAENNAG